MPLEKSLSRIDKLVAEHDPINDREVRALKARDIYGASIQFGDPFVFFHIVNDPYRRYRDLEFSHFAIGLCLDRGWQSGQRLAYIDTIVEGFPDVMLLSSTNLQRFLYEHDMVTAFRNHVIARNKA